MNLIDIFRKEIKHNIWANREVFLNLKNNNFPAPECLKLLSHIAAAEFLWLARIKEERGSFEVWPELELKFIGLQLENLAIIWGELEASLPDINFDKEVKYINSKGEAFQNSFGDILNHVFQHSAYHRGQIAAKTRELGLTPVNTDYITAIRKKLIQI